MFLDFKQMVAKIQDSEAALLPKKDDDHAASPVEPIAKALLDCKLVCSHRNTVDKLHGTPQSVKLNTLVHMHDSIAGERSTPDRIIQKGPDPSQDDFKHRQATAETFLCQQVPSLAMAIC